MCKLEGVQGTVQGVVKGAADAVRCQQDAVEGRGDAVEVVEGANAAVVDEVSEEQLRALLEPNTLADTVQQLIEALDSHITG